MYQQLLGTQIRPSRLDPNKDEKYHVDFARYCAGSGINNPLHTIFLNDYLVLDSFYKGEQWIFDDDLGAFLTDQSGASRNRIKLVHDVISPMVKSLMGIYSQQKFEAHAENVSPEAKTRRDEALGFALLLTRQAQAMPDPIKKTMQQSFGLGENEDETKDLFESTYSDKYAKAINALLEWSEQKNNFDYNFMFAAKFMAIQGIGIIQPYENNGEQKFEIVDPFYFAFDRGCKRPDLSDSGYWIKWGYKNPAQIWERWPDISEKTRDKIDQFTRQETPQYVSPYGQILSSTDRLIYYECYWRDSERQEYGYVLDEYGDEIFTQLDYVNEYGEQEGYTKADVIIPKDEKYREFLGKGKKTKIIYKEVLRYCIFTPKEILSTEDGNDIVYEFGILPHQEYDTFNPDSICPPFKCSCVDYHNGRFISPIARVIPTQRIINRAISATDSIMNNSRLSGTILDKNAITGRDGEDEVKLAMAQGETVIVDTARMGVQNVVGTYGTSMGDSLSQFSEYAQMMKSFAQDTTGLNDALQGGGNNPNDLVGVQNMRIQQGMLRQADFVSALERMIIDVYQAVAEQGKRIYAESRYKLTQIVGDENAEVIEITKEMCSEQFRVFVKRIADEDTQKAVVLKVSLEHYQLGLIGAEEYGYLLECHDLEELPKLILGYAKKKAQSAQLQQEADQRKVAYLQQQQEQQQLIEQGNEDADRQLQLTETGMKEQGKLQATQMKTQNKLETTVLTHISQERMKKAELVTKAATEKYKADKKPVTKLASKNKK